MAPNPVIPTLFEKLKEQSILVVLLASVTYYFYMKTETLELMVTDCQKEFRNTLLQMINEREGHSKPFRESYQDRPEE